jgi:hypothetical protein
VGIKGNPFIPQFKWGKKMNHQKLKVNHDIFDEKYRAKNIAFFNLINNGKFKEAYYVCGDTEEYDTLSIITIKNERPMSLPINIFNQAVGSKLLTRETVESQEILVIFGGRIKRIERRDFNKKVKETTISNETRKFWNRVEITESINSILYVLQSGGDVVIQKSSNMPVVSVRLRDDIFYVVKINCLKSLNGNCNCESHSRYFEKKISPTEALNLITDYLSKSDKKTEGFKEIANNIFIDRS